MLKKFALAFATTIGLVLVIGLFLPGDYAAERSVFIKAAPAVVYANVVDLRNWEKWSPWSEADDTMKITYATNTVGKGASSKWTSENSGEGSQTITAAVPNSSIETQLDFGEQGRAQGYWKFTAAGEGTDVTWGFKGSADGNILQKYFGLFIDSLVGPMFEKGLENLKKSSEGQ